MGKESLSGSGDEQPGSYFLEPLFWVKILQCFDVDPESGINKIGSGMKIPDPQHWLRHKPPRPEFRGKA